MKRWLGAVVVAAAVASVLTGCIGTAVRNVEDWLPEQPFVTGIEVIDSTVDELSYRATIRAELDPAATDANIEKLIDDSIAYLATQPGDDVTLQFGINDVDFAVTDAASSRLALRVWHGVVGVPDVTSAYVTAAAVSAKTDRATALAVFDALDPLGVDRQVEAANLTVAAFAACEPSEGALTLARDALADERVNFGTMDLCQGFDVTFDFGYPLETVVDLRAALDAAGGSDFPVRVSVSPQLETSADFHFVAVTPGDAAALPIVATLEASGVAMRYDLAEDRSLAIDSDAATAAELLAIIAADPAAVHLSVITLTGTDTTMSGTLAELIG